MEKIRHGIVISSQRGRKRTAEGAHGWERGLITFRDGRTVEVPLNFGGSGVSALTTKTHETKISSRRVCGDHRGQTLAYRRAGRGK